MRSIFITPKKAYSAWIGITRKPDVTSGKVRVKVLDAGVCTTDREIYEGMYGEPPNGLNFLVMGHESLGVVDKVGKKVKNFKKGDYIVRTVRRQCKDMCLNCENDEQDMCLTGDFKETGIKELDGVMREYYTDTPENLVKVSPEHQDVGVLLEPLSFAVKAVRQIYRVQDRMYWSPQKALIFGAGPIGLLEAMILRLDNVKVDVVAKSEKGNLKSQIVEEIKSHYHTIDTLDKLGKYDIIIESSGNAHNIKAGYPHLNNNGVFCLTSVTGNPQADWYKADKFNLDIVLGNKTIIGVVNSNFQDYVDGEKFFSTFKEKFPETLQKLITRRIPFSQDLNIKELFKKERDDIKVVLDVSEKSNFSEHAQESKILDIRGEDGEKT